MKPTKIPASKTAIVRDLGWTWRQLQDAVGYFQMANNNSDALQRLARIAPYFKMYRSNPDWNL